MVGSEYILVEEEYLATYNKIMMPVPDAQHAPSAAIVPANIEQIQAALKILNKYKIPVYPISTGKNLGYGSAAPVQRGQTVMDSKRMNLIWR